ncbi:excinuclease ABC subunit UvrA [Thermodesulfatator atlanticus]|uniref:hypothetical protein n=1 Tax=Thermodesulfatator atlanticus TaxID=501497 RepID=UPI0004077750|nr:hypothetical protein [Thermodesulfatator atlanticus]
MMRIKGAKIHNLKNVSLELPERALICVTGVSGSGKSSLAFDTICQEARRRYLSMLKVSEPQAFFGEAPPLDAAEGLPPAVGLPQKVPTPSPRSTVGTLSGILNFLRVLFAELGSFRCESCGQMVASFTLQEMLDDIFSFFPENEKLLVLAPLFNVGKEAVSYLTSQGFFRFYVSGRLIDTTEEGLPQDLRELAVLVDRLVLKEDAKSRLEEALRLGLSLTRGLIWLKAFKGEKELRLTRGELCPFCGARIPEIRPESFSFNHPLGACPHCKGLGEKEGQICPICQGARLKKEAQNVFVNGKNFVELCQRPLAELDSFLSQCSFSGQKARVFEGLFTEIAPRLRALLDLGLEHLELFRPATRLSLGELQRLRVAAFFGERLSGCLYVFDEPGVGLSPFEKERLLFLFRELVAQGNTVILVEHDPFFITAADVVVEMGPGAGKEGGEILFVGPPEELARRAELPTGSFLSGKKRLSRRKIAAKKYLEVCGKKIIQGGLTCLCGPSGAGKTSLLKELARSPLANFITPAEARGRESIVASYIEALRPLRELFAATKEARARGLKPSHFSFFAKEGRCPLCKGQGKYEVKIPYLPSLWAVCEECLGTRFRRDVLEIRYRGLNIHEVLSLTVDEAFSFFARVPSLVERLSLLAEVGLGYLILGQELASLSGGERQRLRLARLLLKREKSKLLLFDVPTVGLHLKDVEKLLILFERLMAEGYSIVVADNHPAFVLLADELWELSEGEVIFSGSPNDWLSRRDHFARYFDKYRSFIES